MTAPLRNALARLAAGQPASPPPTAPQQAHPGGSNAAPVPAVAPIADAAAPVADELAEALRRIGLDETEIRTFPDTPSIFQRIGAMHETLERIAALLEAQRPKEPIYEVRALSTTGPYQVRKHGRRYVGLRTQAATNQQVNILTPTGAMTLTIGSTFLYYLVPEGTGFQLTTGASPVNMEFVYADDIAGGMPQ